MPNFPNPLIDSRTKVERAKKHIQDLNVALKAFLDSNPYKIGTKRNPKTRQLIYYLTEVAEVPPYIAAIAGDAIHNMRSALNYLAYQLVVVGTRSPESLRSVEFPIFDSANEFEAGKQRKIEGMRPEAIEAIDMVKPYKGGNDQLWRIHRLNNIDKHRLLITVGSYFQSFDIGTLLSERMNEAFPDFGEIPIVPVFLNPADKMCPLKAGNELFIDIPDAEVNEKMQFHFNVSLSEPQVIEVEPILTTLQYFIDVVEEVIESFDSHIFWSP